MLRSAAVKVCLALAFILPTVSHALDIKKKDNVVFISGDIDPKNNAELKEALVGAKGLVIGRIAGGGEVGMMRSFASVISAVDVPVVSSDVCGWFCTYMFMAGKQRVFGVSPSSGTSMILISKMGVRTNGGLPTPWTGNYAMLSGTLSDAMPRDLLRKYVENNDFPMGILAIAPTTEHPEGAMVECQDVRKLTTCKLLDGLTALKAGVVTSVETFPIPAF